jgi:uncharacterized protein (TIGR00730 family)
VSILRSVCVFTGSRPGRRPGYATAAAEFGRELAARELRLVYGGGNVGLMGIVADAVLEGGGQAVGVIPEMLRQREVAHQHLSALHVVDTMHERKAMMARQADAFVAMPGGLGTLEELFEVLTWSQLGIHTKPCALLNVEGYYDALIAFIDRQVEEGFVAPAHRALILVDSDPATLLDRVAAQPSRPAPKNYDSI